MISARRVLTLAATVLVLAQAVTVRAADNAYVLGPDSQFRPEVPHGTVTRHTFLAGSDSIYPGTVRDYWLYVPKQYDGSKPACLMVFQDGGGYVSTNGQWRVPVVFDNLIAKGDMPVTIGVFVNPGVVPSQRGTNALPRFNRSYEYDGLGDRYARFLAEELLPEVQKTHLITPDPNGRAIGGASSGAVAAFTAAWERPDLFRRVFSTIGTYVGLRGANDYPILVRKSEPRPIRVFLQDGYNDQNIYGGNWWIANQDMFSALEFAGYEVEKAWGTGGHDGKHGGAVLPDALRWLWKGYPAPLVAGSTDRQPATRDVLVPGEGWQLIGQGYAFPGGLAAAESGEVFFADFEGGRVYKVGLEGAVTVARSASNGAQALAFRPDGRLLATQPQTRRIALHGGPQTEEILVADHVAKDLVVAHSGVAYFTDPSTRSVKSMGPDGKVSTLDTGIEFPNGLCLSPDQSLLYVSDMVGQFVYGFQVGLDGTLSSRQPYFHLHLADDPRGSGADGMCVDADGRLYVATPLGIQFCDQAGRVNGILSRPEHDGWISDVCLGGRDRSEIFVTCGNKVWKRRVKAKAALPHAAPVVPAPPRL